MKYFDWVDVGMVGYDYGKQLYSVAVTDMEWSGAKAGHYAVPRIRLMFLAEDPNIFVARVKEAFMERQRTEALLR